MRHSESRAAAVSTVEIDAELLEDEPAETEERPPESTILPIRKRLHRVPIPPSYTPPSGQAWDRGGGLIVQKPRRVAPLDPTMRIVRPPISVLPPPGVQAPGSVPPISFEPVPRPRVVYGDQTLFVIIGVAVALVISAFLAAGVVAVKRARVPPTGSLVVTVSGPNARAISSPRVSVDGQIACEKSPCRISELKRGAHFVQVEAPGFGQSALRAVVVEADVEAITNIELSPEPPANAR